LAYFYCDYKDSRTHDPLNILGALARQIILHNEDCFEDLENFYKTHLSRDSVLREATPKGICELIRTVSARFKTVMIIVDGLDEISMKRAEITKCLCSLNTPTCTIKTIFASRLEVDIRDELEEYTDISIAARSTDLRLYVASEIERRTKERKLGFEIRL